ncbi:MAG: NAD(P)/FAD-dependent oxidoreductase [Xanthobacteraceae bacterium]
MSDEFDLVVVGSGIAGLTAALTGARLGLKTLVLTGDVLGGQLVSINHIDGFPGFADGVAGYDLCPIAQEQAVTAGAEFASATLDRIAPRPGGWRLAAGIGQEYLARGVILATGASLKPLGVPGEERLRGKGVSHCANCDAPLLRGKNVAVIGGGDSAAQEALTLAESVAKVFLLHRGRVLSAQAAYCERVMQQPKIEARFNQIVEEVLGDSDVTGLCVRDQTTGATATLEVAAVFIYVGLNPNTAFLGGLFALDDTGGIPTDISTRTALTGICAAGAVRSGWPGRAAASAGEGATAAIAIERYLRQDDWGDWE